MKKRTKILVLMLLATISVMALASSATEGPSKRWSEAKAWEWYGRVAPIRGVNYVPSTAVNMLEWWQAETFDPATIDRELGWAHESGYTSVRCNLSFEVWAADPEGLKKRLDQFLGTAARHEIRAALCLFDDVNFARARPVVGRQPDPIPGVHNSRWVPSPSPEKVTDRAVWPTLEEYVRDIVGRFREDTRVLIWDLYNEPGNGGLGEKSLPLVKATFGWARAVDPVQPLTTGPWRDHGRGMAKAMAGLSDVVSFHAYSPAAVVEETIALYEGYGRPLICTETIRRLEGQDYAAVLPVFAEHKVSWYSWGLVAGKQQTHLPWEEKGRTIEDPWHWDMLWPDGTPYDPGEIELVKSFTFDPRRN
jgi:hypothetical protein